ncbi:MAG TPA: NRAMP family divalent metal transporter [Trebonia sp.]|nr:NRAMP family divalent metal transporter [Trebonia sp.]
MAVDQAGRFDAGDITGALGTLKRDAAVDTRSWRRKLRLLLVIVGPGLIVMGGGNDAGGVQVYAQMGQDYGMRLLWTLVLLFPILYMCQEMVVRLGAVSGTGHGRLIFARFGKFWGTFSVGDLFVINAVTVVAEFIGVQQALSFFGLPGPAAVGASAALLFAVMVGGTYRYWERFLIVLVIVNFASFPLLYFTRSSPAQTISGVVPSMPGGLNATLLLLVVAVVGTTVEPWQLFFQQSNVVDKRITQRWINYERLDTGLGVLIEVTGALVLMAACAFGLAHTGAFGNFTSLSDTAAALQRHIGHGAGYLLALAALDGSLIGANLTALTTAYTLGDVYPRFRHTLHARMRQAPVFYGLYAVLVGVAAIVTLAWGNDLGVVIDGVEALNGILLPSALVFLVLLCNDKAILGPWVNGTVQNWICGVIVWAVLTFSLAPVVTTFFPNVTLTQCEYAFAVCGAGGLVVAAIMARARRSGGRAGQKLTRAELRDQRAQWQAPPVDTLPRPGLSTGRRIGLLVLRGYIIFAIVIMVLKLIQVTA